MADEKRYISDLALKRLCCRYINEEKSPNILAEEKQVILQYLRKMISILIRPCHEKIQGEEKMRQALLNLEIFRDMDMSKFFAKEFLLGCIDQQWEGMRLYFTTDLKLNLADKETSLQEEYLNFISTATQYLIQEAAKTLSVVAVSAPSQKNGVVSQKRSHDKGQESFESKTGPRKNQKVSFGEFFHPNPPKKQIKRKVSKAERKARIVSLRRSRHNTD
jgi:hypothetical protein